MNYYILKVKKGRGVVVFESVVVFKLCLYILIPDIRRNITFCHTTTVVAAGDRNIGLAILYNLKIKQR